METHHEKKKPLISVENEIALVKREADKNETWRPKILENISNEKNVNFNVESDKDCFHVDELEIGPLVSPIDLSAKKMKEEHLPISESEITVAKKKIASTTYNCSTNVNMRNENRERSNEKDTNWRGFFEGRVNKETLEIGMSKENYKDFLKGPSKDLMRQEIKIKQFPESGISFPKFETATEKVSRWKEIVEQLEEETLDDKNTYWTDFFEGKLNEETLNMKISEENYKEFLNGFQKKRGPLITKIDLKDFEAKYQ